MGSSGGEKTFSCNIHCLPSFIKMHFHTLWVLNLRPTRMISKEKFCTLITQVN